MEVVALNEQLREEFAGVVKHFLTIRRDEIARVAAAAVVSASQTDVAAVTTSKRSADHEPQPEPSSETTSSAAALSPAAPLPLPGALLPERTRQYATLAKTILRKVNTYQYTSREQFGQDIAELLLLTDANDQKLLLRQLVDQQYALQATAKPLSTKRQKVNGIRIDSATIAGIQCGMQGQWTCNVDMGGNTSTTSRWNSREKAEAIGYKAEVRDALRESPESAKAIVKVTRELAAACAKFDSDVLRDAMKQVKQRLPISKHHDVSSLTAALTPHVATPHSTVNQATTPILGKEKDAKSSRKRELLVDTAVPVAAAIPASQGKPITPAAATPELVAKRTPTDNHSRVTFLRLRRLIQIRLCRHLEGREICARLNGNDPGHGESWKPTGRLERGKVFSYSTKKFVSFSDFVLASLKRSVAACEHLYLLDTRENIDAHLLVCDQFSDDFRQRLDENFKEVSEQYKQGKLL